MRTATLRSLLSVFLAPLVLAAPVLPAAAAAGPTAWSTPAGPLFAQQPDEDRFFDALAARARETPLAGPFDGDLLQSDEVAAGVRAGVEVDSFIASVKFRNPEDATKPWDFGFDFANSNESTERVLVDSTGSWFYAPYPGNSQDNGPAPSLDTTPGSLNTLDLVVDGNTALLGVNGQYVTTITLQGPTASDVSIITSSFNATTIDGRLMRYDDFAIWALPGGATTSTQQPVQEGPITEPGQDVSANTPAGSSSPDNEAIFNAATQMAQSANPDAGPLADSLQEQDGGMLSLYGAGIILENFQASAEFTVPISASETPWDAGFIFGGDASGGVRVVVDSNGSWLCAFGGGAPTQGGPVANLNTSPGATNTLSLFVFGDEAMLGVNGTFAARFTLPVTPGAGGIGVGTGFFSDQIEPGRVTEFQNFEVRDLNLNDLGPLASQSLPADLAPAPETTQEQPGVDDGTQAAVDQGETTVAQTTGIVDPTLAAQFTDFLAVLEANPPSEGPTSSQLVERGQGQPIHLAGPITRNAADFSASVTVTNPEETSTGWTFGFGFRENDQVVLSSTGEVIAITEDGLVQVVGQAENFDPAPGADNALQVLVMGDVLGAGVNGALVGMVRLPGPNFTGGTGVAIIGGVFPEDQQAGRAIPYENYRVWYMTE